jgi:hypothetical protein
MKITSLRASNNWLVWRYEQRKDSRKPTKVPYSPLDNYGVGTDEADRRRLATYEIATKNAANSYDGAGFVFTCFNDLLYICGIDIDHQDTESAFVKGIIALFPNAYIERSPSGAGVHIVLLVNVSRIPQITENGKPKLDKRYYSKNPHNGVEAYIAGLTNRYFTHMGDTIQDGQDTDQTSEFLQFLDLYMLRSQTGGKSQTNAVSDNMTPKKGLPPALSDGQLLYKARNAANGAKFVALFDNGDISGYNGDDSGADMGLMNMLSFWTRRDREQMERLFSGSALGQREKWTARADYRQATIDRAINDCKTVYEPQNHAGEDEEFLKPTDYTDVGESLVLAGEYASALRHSAATKFIVYDGKVWVENEARARGCLYPLKDATGAYIFANTESGGQHRLFGFAIVLDDNLPAGTVLFGNFRYYGVNIPQGIAVEVSRESGFTSGLIDYRALTIADGKPIVPAAFVKVEVDAE